MPSKAALKFLFGIVFFTVVLGLAIYLAFWFANGFHGVDGPQVEPDAELETANMQVIYV